MKQAFSSYAGWGLTAVAIMLLPLLSAQASEQSEQLTVHYRTHSLDRPVVTQYRHTGPVTVTVTGTGQAAGTQRSDAFYIFTDYPGRDRTPVAANEFGLYINGRPAAELIGSRPAYQASHTYTFRLDGNGQPLQFAIGEYGLSDNSGSWQITVRSATEDAGTPQGMDNVDEWVSVDASRNTLSNPARTQRYYTGRVTIQTEGIMHTSGTSISDGYYILTTYDGRSVEPIPANEFSLYVNGRQISEIAPRPYQNLSTYQFTIDVGTTPQRLSFAIGDRYLADNAGFFRIGVQGDQQAQPHVETYYYPYVPVTPAFYWQSRPVVSHSQSSQDSDQDGLSDAAERIIGSNPYSRDSDGDGYDDLTEVNNGYSPTDPAPVRVNGR